VARDLANLASLLQAVSRLEEAEGLMRRALKIDEASYGPDHAIVAVRLNNLAQLLKAANRLPDAEALMKQVLSMWEKSLGANNPQVAIALNNLASLYQQTNRNGEAEPLLRRALALTEAGLGSDHPDVAVSLNNLAQLLQATNRLAEAEPLMRRALAITETALGAHHQDVAIRLNNLASLLQDTNHLSEAEGLMRRALVITEETLGAHHPDYARNLNNLAQLLQATNRLSEAEPLLRRALAISEVTLGSEHPIIAVRLNNLGLLLLADNRFAPAEVIFRRALRIEETAFGPDHPNVARDLDNLGALLKTVGRLGEAEPLMLRALKIDESSSGAESVNVARDLSNLAELLQAANRFVEAEQQYRRALKIYETSYNPEHDSVALPLSNLATLLQITNRSAEAQLGARRALAIWEKHLGPNHPQVASALNNLAVLLHADNQVSEAESLLRRALKIDEAVYGPKHTEVARALNNLAMLVERTDHAAEAEPLLQRVLEIDEGAYGLKHPRVSVDINNLAALFQSTRRYAEAEPLLRRSLEIDEAVYGRDHPRTAADLHNLASVLQEKNEAVEAEGFWRALAIEELALGDNHPTTVVDVAKLAELRAAQNDWAGALAQSRRALTSTIAAGRRVGSGRPSSMRLLAKQSSHFRAHVQYAFHVGANDPALTDEAFTLGQRAAAATWPTAQMRFASRFAQGDGELAKLLREQDALIKDVSLIDQRLFSDSGKRESGGLDGLRKQQAELDRRLDAIAIRLAQDFPDYVALTNPEPLKISAVQDLLKPDEALVQFIESPSGGSVGESSYAWAVTKTAVRWVELPLSGKKLAERVAALRCGLDADAWRAEGATACSKLLNIQGKPDPAKPLPYDLNGAHELYKALFGQIADLTGDKRLLIAPSESLMALPFQTLVSEKADQPQPSASQPLTWERYRNVKWLGRDHAITMLSSAASLAGRRKAAKPHQATEPFIGFGSPALVGGLARDLGASSQTATAGATETAIKSATLNRYRSVYFAAYGLISGGKEKLGQDSVTEPGLALTPPQTLGDGDDGFLAASEVAKLKFDADWVVISLSTPQKDGAPAAGAAPVLARAFSYAGARALLLSNWVGQSDQGAKLMTQTFKTFSGNATISQAEALRRATLGVMDGPSPQDAHPASWAQFTVFEDVSAGR
jgi:tetratricopeptide (TPR) repeat protein